MAIKTNIFKLDAVALDDAIEERVRAIVSPVVTVRIVDAATNILKKEMTGVHKLFGKLMYLIQKGHHVYLWGPPGSGKSTAAQQCAEALGRKFAYISLNPQTPESKILGYMDAGGTYRKTPFFECYVEGGVFCIDEQDNASPALLTTLNSLLENGHGAFPHGIFKRSPEFVLVSTGNTNGRGANPMFPERRPFDSAFSERFTFMKWPYDQNLEKAIAKAINRDAQPWIEWVFKTREHCFVHHPRVLLSPRATFKGADYMKDDTLSMAEIAEMVVFKGVDADTSSKILVAFPLPERKGGGDDIGDK